MTLRRRLGRAAEEARRRGIPVQKYNATIRRWEGPGGFEERNRMIADDCDALVLISSSKMRTFGSEWTRDRARERRVPTEDFVLQQS